MCTINYLDTTTATMVYFSIFMAKISKAESRFFK